jgi:flavodoxin I
MSMKAGRVLTCKAIFYYSTTGNTKAIIDHLEGFDVYRLNKIKYNELDFKEYETLLLGTSTFNNGLPPVYFKHILPQLYQLEGRRIGLFGSGQSIFGDLFCGALDVLEEILKAKNIILFKFKVDGYPRKGDFDNFNKLLKEHDLL